MLMKNLQWVFHLGEAGFLAGSSIIIDAFSMYLLAITIVKQFVVRVGISLMSKWLNGYITYKCLCEVAI